MALIYRWALIAVLFGVVFYVGICVALYFSQSKLIFPSNMVGLTTGSPRIKINSDDGATEVLVVEKNARCDVLYFGGNAEGVDLSLAPLSKTFAQCNVLAMVYRGYSAIPGEPSQHALFTDALALYHLRINNHPERRFILVGRSLGAAVATYLAAQVPVEQLVLVTPFDSLSHLVQQKFPWIPTHWLLKFPFPSDQYAQSIKVPVHIILAEEDEIIPAENSLLLFEAFKSTKPHLTRLERVGHNTIDEHPRYLSELGRLL